MSGPSHRAKRMKTEAAPPQPSPDIFQRMISGDLPCHLIFETDHSIALLDHRPVRQGHSVLIPRKRWRDISDTACSPDDFGMFCRDLVPLAHAVRSATGAHGVDLVQNSSEAGLAVPGLHFDVLPRFGSEPSPLLSVNSSNKPSTPIDDSQALQLLCQIQNALPSFLCPSFSSFAPEDTDTVALAASLSNLVQAGDVITLSGELGAGKTSFARGLIRAYFQNPTLDVPSPTYLLCLSYSPDSAYTEANAEARSPSIYHIDPFRLKQKHEGKVAALVDMEKVFREDITLIEWPEKIGKSVVSQDSPPRLEVRIEGIGPQGAGRRLIFKGVGDRWSSLVQHWRSVGAIAPLPGQPTSSRGFSSSDPSLSSEATLSTKPSLPTDSSQWLVLGIETSCDDTGAAVIRGDGTILGEELASQAGLHEQYGGVKPDVAQQAHRAAIESTIDAALSKANIAPSELSAVAVTVGPGLALCLEVGVRKALEIASKNHLPIVRVHHMEAHALMTTMPGVLRNITGEIQYPVLTLLVSGGHNMLVLTRGIGKHLIIGTTLDDSVGEAFDKTARLLGVEKIPGGPELEKMAREGDPRTYQNAIPMPLSKTKNAALRTGCDFSFAGVKTSVRDLVKAEEARIKALPEEEQDAALLKMRNDVSAAFQNILVAHLVDRTRRALDLLESEKPTALVVAGGVAANQLVRTSLEVVARDKGLPLLVPPIKYCTDNGVMVAWAGVERLKQRLYELPPSAASYERHVEVRPRWPLGPRDPRSGAK